MEAQDNNPKKDKSPKSLFLDQIKNNICKIISNDGKIGTGFFCKISFPQSSASIKVLMTTNHILGDNDITPEKNIQIILYNEQSFNLSIGDSRRIYTEKLFDITIIEIKNEDNLNIGDQLLEIDEQVIDDNAIRNNMFIDKSVYLCDFSNKEIMCSVGLVQEISSNDYSIQTLCFNKRESSGGPMFNSSNSKIIGIHKGSKGGMNWKYGTFIRGPIEYFNQKYNLNLIPISNQNNFNPMYQGNMNNNINNNINQNQLSNYNNNMNGNQNTGYQNQNINYNNNNFFNQNMNNFNPIQNMNNYTKTMINQNMNNNQNQGMNNFNQNMNNFNQNQNLNNNQNQNMNDFNQNMNDFNQNMNNNNQNMNNNNQNMNNNNQNINNFNPNQNMNNNNQNMNNFNPNQNMNNNNQNMNNFNQNQNMNNNNQNINNYNQNQNMNNNNQNINNYNQNQNINNYNNYINNTPNNYQQNMNNNNYINNNINMNYANNNNNSNMNNNNINFNSNYIMNNNNMNQNNNIFNQNYSPNMNMNQNSSYNNNENIKSLYCFRYIKEDKLNIRFSIYKCTYITTQIPKFITKNELYYIADSIKNKTLFEFSDPNGIVLFYDNNKIQKDDSDIKFLKDNTSIQILDNSAPEYDYTYYTQFEQNINDKKGYINLFFDYDCIKYNMQFPKELPFNEASHAFFSKYAIEKSNRDKFNFNFKLGSSVIEATNTTPIKNLDLIDISNLKIEAKIMDPYKKIEYPGKHIKAILLEKFGDLMPHTEFHVGTLQQIKNLYELISFELETKQKENQNKKKKMIIHKNKYPFLIVINEKEINPEDEIIFSSLGIKDDFSFKLLNKTIYFKKN